MRNPTLLVSIALILALGIVMADHMLFVEYVNAEDECANFEDSKKGLDCYGEKYGIEFKYNPTSAYTFDDITMSLEDAPSVQFRNYNITLDRPATMITISNEPPYKVNFTNNYEFDIGCMDEDTTLYSARLEDSIKIICRSGGNK